MCRITASRPGCVGACPSVDPGSGGARYARGFPPLYHRVTGPTGFHVDASPDCRRRPVGACPGRAFYSLRRIAGPCPISKAESAKSWEPPLVCALHEHLVSFRTTSVLSSVPPTETSLASTEQRLRNWRGDRSKTHTLCFFPRSAPSLVSVGLRLRGRLAPTSPARSG